ncbi:LysR family transcriptional regulator [Halomonas organivorans]|uniref:DNA-binding transcriptional LysR family regulator n=1 Tax=Halomonas organivorans TaxID=257772 RepID=A0A7W5G4Q6_9GAMM|nr:LysR family transcriptional regulator [Halomonas organivorans]MBB3139611.1 DNA-binding transcriptional LysR family regulator [Halomonas organivorans]
MELSQLRVFLVIAEELNLTRAAAKLHMTQPPLSRRIKTIEEELGTQLFFRSPRGLSLTATGEFLHEQAKQILSKVETSMATIRQMERGQAPIFGIGFVPSVFYGQLPLLVRSLRQKDEVELALRELTTVEQVQALKAGRIDLGFGRLKIDDPEIEQKVLFDEPLIAALPADHPLRDRQPTLAELAEYPLILFPATPRPSLADMVQGQFRRRGIAIRVVQETNELQTALGLVASGLGITLVPEQVSCVHRPGIVFTPLADETITSPVIYSRRKGEPLSPVMRQVDALLSEEG